MRRTYSWNSDEPNWTQRFPFALEYVSESWYRGAAWDVEHMHRRLRWNHYGGGTTTLDKFETEIPAFELDYSDRVQWAITTADYNSCSTEYEKNLSVYYWEVELARVDRLQLDALGVGFNLKEGAVTCYATGDMVLRDEVIQQTDGFQASDIVGCGWLQPSTFILTKNGKIIVALEGIDGVDEARFSFYQEGPGPPSNTDRTFVRFNFGQRRFVFDIQNFVKLHFSRAQYLAANLPVEIMENIVYHIVDYTPCDIWHQLALVRVSHVNRLWRHLCFLWLPDQLEVHNSEQLIHSSVAFLLPSVRHLSVLCDFGSSAEFLRFLYNNPTTGMPQLEECSLGYSKRRTELGRHFPPHITPAIPSLLGSQFRNLLRLNLCTVLFESWVHFAQLVFAFPQLHDLRVDKVTWTNRPLAILPVGDAWLPPDWSELWNATVAASQVPPPLPSPRAYKTRFLRRLGTLRISRRSHQDHRSGLLWLLFLGQSIRSACAFGSDLVLSLQEAEAVAAIVYGFPMDPSPNDSLTTDWASTVKLEHPDKNTYNIIARDHATDHDPPLFALTFNRSPSDAAVFRLTKMTLSIELFLVGRNRYHNIKAFCSTLDTLILCLQTQPRVCFDFSSGNYLNTSLGGEHGQVVYSECGDAPEDALTQSMCRCIVAGLPGYARSGLLTFVYRDRIIPYEI